MFKKKLPAENKFFYYLQPMLYARTDAAGSSIFFGENCILEVAPDKAEKITQDYSTYNVSNVRINQKNLVKISNDLLFTKLEDAQKACEIKNLEIFQNLLNKLNAIETRIEKIENHLKNITQFR